MTHNSRGGLRRFLIPVGILAAVAGVWLGVSYFDFGSGVGTALPVEKMRAGTPLPQPKVLSSFSLTDQDSRPFGLDDLKGRWSFVSIGFTSCGHVCPTNMATYEAIDRAINAADEEPTANFLFISVDPERDSPERLGRYVRRFNPRFLGATGSHDQLQSLARALGVMYARSAEQETGGTDYYRVDHSASILLLDPQARLVAVFSWPHDSAAMAADFAVMKDYYQRGIASDRRVVNPSLVANLQ